MKKYYAAIIILLVIISVDLRAQNVGIGTTNPVGRLHIDLTTIANEDAIIINDDTNPVMRFRRNGVEKSFFQLINNDFRIGIAANNDSGRLILRTNGIDRVYINDIGNVGIAAPDPLSRLHIGSGSDVSLTSNGYMMLGNPGGTNIVFDNNEIQARSDSAVTDLFFQAEGGKTQFGRTNDSNIEIENSAIQARFNNTTETLILQNSGGKVRIGNGFDFADTRLQITAGGDAGVGVNQSGFLMLGQSNGLNIVFDNNEILARDNGVVSTLFLARDGSKVQLGNGNEATGTKLHISTGNEVGLGDAQSGYLMMGSQGGANIIVDNNEIQARNNGASSNLFLQNAGGNVRIGDGAAFTSSHKLGVAGDVVVTGNLRVGTTVLPGGYSFGVDGRIICTEVLVRTVPNWPDYVFNKGYKLRDLNELSRFIERNKHLPNIPSASEIEKNGVTLGEMQRLQMEKIEELTLYILELKKEIEQLKQKR